MASRNPLGKIKDLTKGAGSAGLHVAGQATTTAVSLTSGVVGKLVGGRKPADSAAAPAPTAPEAPARTSPEPAAEKTPAKKAPAKKPAKKAPAKKVSTSEPVNVTEELGLDPAPVDQPTATTSSPDAGKPLTTIDAAADTEHVEATPADIAKAVAKQAPAKKAPAKTTPGAKLPPRKKAAKAEQTT